MDLNNFKVKLTGFDPKTSRHINFYVEPEEAEKATQDPSYKNKLVDEAIQNVNKKLEEMAKQSTIVQVVPLVLNDGVETYTLFVTPTDYDFAKRDIKHAQNLLDQHKKTMVEQLHNAAATNFIQDDLTSVPSGSKTVVVDMFEESTNQTYRLTVTHEAYKRASLDKDYATALLESHKKATNVPLNADNPDDDNADDIIEQTEPDENDLNVGNGLPCGSKVGPKKRNKNTKAAKVDNPRAIWPAQCVQCLLQLYKQYSDSYDAGKITYNKFWGSIQQDMEKEEYEYTIQQCINKLDALKRKYKDVMDHNGQTGKAPITCEYFDDLNELFHKKPWIQPLSTAGSNITLDMDDVEAAHHKTKRTKVGGTALRAQFINETLKFQKQRLEIQQKKLELETNYKKDKLEILKKFSGKY